MLLHKRIKKFLTLTTAIDRLGSFESASGGGWTPLQAVFSESHRVRSCPSIGSEAGLCAMAFSFSKGISRGCLARPSGHLVQSHPGITPVGPGCSGHQGGGPARRDQNPPPARPSRGVRARGLQATPAGSALAMSATRRSVKTWPRLLFPITEPQPAVACPACGRACEAYPGNLFNCPDCRLAFVVTTPRRWKALAPDASRDDNLTTSPMKNAHGYGDSLGGAVESFRFKDSTNER